MDYSSSITYNKGIEKSNIGFISLLRRFMIPLLWLAITVTIVYYGICIVGQIVETKTLNANQQIYVQKINDLDIEIDALRLKIQNAQNIDEIRYKASTELNMIKRDEKQAISIKENVVVSHKEDKKEKQLDEFSFVAAVKSIFNR